MPAPFEDEVIKYIGNRRPLKLILMFVAGVGIVSSAYKTIQPVAESLRPTAYRLLDVKLEPGDRQKYACAYFSGGAQWNIQAASEVARSLGPAAIAKVLVSYQTRLSTCLNALGYSAPGSWTASSADAKEVERAQAATVGALYAFAGTLQSKDRLSYLVNQIGSDVAFVMTQQMDSRDSSRLDQRASMTTALAQFETDIARRMEESLEEARKLCPCKLPSVEGRPYDNRKALLAYAQSLDDAMTREFPNPLLTVRAASHREPN